jgi:Mor family transcriptional regulator
MKQGSLPMSNEPRSRPELSDLTPEQIAPLEALMGGAWPDTWRDLAHSHYLTLLGQHPAALPELAALAVELTRGIAQDLGGTQPYIPVGHFFAADAKAMRIVQGFTGDNHRELAVRENITESRVRQILSAWRREQFERRQGALALE